MWPHEEAHCNNFEHHFGCVDKKKEKIDDFIVLGNEVDFLIKGQKETIDHNNEQNESIEPWVDCN